MKIIGITGSIGSGKTYLSSIIKNMGYFVYNPDDWTRDLYKKADFLVKIKTLFPQVFEKNIFNKKKLRNIVFNDNKELKKLESLIHPLLKTRLKKTIKKYAKTNNLIFLDVALLLEMKWDIYCDFIILADAQENIQIKTVMERDNIKEDDVKKILEKQINNKIKMEKADIVIDTTLPYGINKVQLINIIKEVSE